MVDTLRIGLANAIGVGKQHVTVTLMPAANSTERVAFGHFLDDVNRLNLRLPGDPSRRTLQFRCSNG